jgi:hypothetical protein
MLISKTTGNFHLKTCLQLSMLGYCVHWQGYTLYKLFRYSSEIILWPVLIFKVGRYFFVWWSHRTSLIKRRVIWSSMRLQPCLMFLLKMADFYFFIKHILSYPYNQMLLLNMDTKRTWMYLAFLFILNNIISRLVYFVVIYNKMLLLPPCWNRKLEVF